MALRRIAVHSRRNRPGADREDRPGEEARTERSGMSYRLLDMEATPRREALRLIVEVFRDGHRAAEDLRGTAEEMTALQLESELEEIEERMISRISLICDTYQLQDHTAPRN
jgi:hypothetical protein